MKSRGKPFAWTTGPTIAAILVLCTLFLLMDRCSTFISHASP